MNANARSSATKRKTGLDGAMSKLANAFVPLKNPRHKKTALRQTKIAYPTSVKPKLEPTWESKPEPKPVASAAVAAAVPLVRRSSEVSGVATATWCDAYAPTAIDETVLQPKVSKDAALAWLSSRISAVDDKGPRVLILRGPSGCGKAAFIRTAAAKLGAVVEQPEGVDTFGKLVSIVQDGVRTRTLSLTSEARRARVWLFTGIDGFAEGGDESEDATVNAKRGAGAGAGPSAGIRKRAGNAIGTLVDIIRKSFLPMSDGGGAAALGSRSGSHKTAMHPIVLTLHDFSTRAVGCLQNLDAVKVITVSALDKASCRFATMRAVRLAAAPLPLTPLQVDDIIETCYGDVRQCVMEAQMRQSVVTSFGSASKFKGRRDVVLDVFETTRRLLNVSNAEIEAAPGCIPFMLDAHANGLQLVASNWLFNMDIAVRCLRLDQEADAMACIARACDGWCLMQEATAWYHGRPPTTVQVEAGLIVGMLQLRKSRAAMTARTPLGKLEHVPAFRRAAHRSAALEAVRSASTTTFSCGNVELNERLWCACELARGVGKTVRLPAAPTRKALVDARRLRERVADDVADDVDDEDTATLGWRTRHLADLSLAAVDPFFALYGIPRSIAMDAFPDCRVVHDAASTSAPALCTEWKILDVKGWRETSFGF